jgi:hypothetical protein
MSYVKEADTKARLARALMSVPRLQRLDQFISLV